MSIVPRGTIIVFDLLFNMAADRLWNNCCNKVNCWWIKQSANTNS